MHQVLFLRQLPQRLLEQNLLAERQLTPLVCLPGGGLCTVGTTSCIPRAWFSVPARPTETLGTPCVPCLIPHPLEQETEPKGGRSVPKGTQRLLQARGSATRPGGSHMAGPWEDTQVDQDLGRSKQALTQLSRHPAGAQWEPCRGGVPSSLGLRSVQSRAGDPQGQLGWGFPLVPASATRGSALRAGCSFLHGTGEV